MANLPGFVGNRCIFVYVMESMLLLEGNDDDFYYNDNDNSNINTTNDFDKNTATVENLIGIGGLSIRAIDEAIR